MGDGGSDLRILSVLFHVNQTCSSKVNTMKTQVIFAKTLNNI